MKTKLPNLPFFVYGTLLRGHPNYDRLTHKHGAVPYRVESATCYRHALWVMPRGTFPYMIQKKDLPAMMLAQYTRSDTPEVVGELHFYTDKDFPKMLEAFDQLEGVANDHYARKQDEVWYKGERQQAHMYYAPSDLVPWLFHNPTVADGSWARYVKQHKLYPLPKGT